MNECSGKQGIALFLDLDAGHMGVSSCENSLGFTLMI